MSEASRPRCKRLPGVETAVRRPDLEQTTDQSETTTMNTNLNLVLVALCAALNAAQAPESAHPILASACTNNCGATLSRASYLARASAAARTNRCDISEAAAHRDCSLAGLILKGYGLASPQSRTYTNALGIRLEVPIVPVAGWVVTEDLIAEVRAHNEAVEAEIRRRLGQGTSERATKGAERERRNWFDAFVRLFSDN